MRFRKRPVVVEAEQLTWANWDAVCALIGEFPDGMRGVYVKNGEVHDEFPGEGCSIGLMIPTLEGTMRADEGDFIIKGTAGEFYPCKPYIFKQTYEAV